MAENMARAGVKTITIRIQPGVQRARGDVSVMRHPLPPENAGANFVSVERYVA
jgi:hypothetical protein